MTRRHLIFPALLLLGPVRAQTPDAVKVPLTDPSRPANVRVTVLNGSIVVRGYEGKEVIVQSSRREGGNRNTPEKAKGLRRIDLDRGGFTVEEQDNRVEIHSGPNASPEIVVQVPRRASLYLRLTNGGGITAENIEGEIDANATNGFLTLKNISGSVIGHALNSDVTVTFAQVAAGKPMSFTSLNGDIDVTLPGDTRARLKMKTDNGDIFTDFELKLEPGQAPVVEQPRSERARYRVKIDRAVTGSVNGGGPDYQFTSQNGKIYIRKK